MGQSYDENGSYIGWSPFFNYTSYATLQASKKLPVPKFIMDKNTGKRKVQTLLYDEDGLDVTAEFADLNKYILSNGKLHPELSESLIVAALHKIAAVLRKIGTTTNIKYDEDHHKHIMQALNNHYHYHFAELTEEGAYKNVASANIYNVAHDIRNRDLAYTAISMDIIRDSAKNSPKGSASAKLNMFNPLTKYLMQYLNLLGKNVISVAANGEKVWFNSLYFWHDVLKNGSDEDVQNLRFQHTFKRILGRSNKKPEESTRDHLPDLNKYNDEIKSRLYELLHIDIEDEEYVYVDLMISQLLSAATDNAKELILAKINAGTNYARMYITGIMLGFNLDDLVTFMTSPVGEYIDSVANNNIFSESERNNWPSTAIKKAEGTIYSMNFLHGKYSYLEYNPEEDRNESVSLSKSDYVLDRLRTTKLVSGLEKVNDKPYFRNLDLCVHDIIQTCLENGTDFDFTSIGDINDAEINNYLQYCNITLLKLKTVVGKYPSYLDYKDDIAEFGKLYGLATEISGVASAWLGLNQGLPTSEVDLLKRLNSMGKVISRREKALGVSNFFVPRPTDSAKLKEKREKALADIVKRLSDNNPTLSPEKIKQILLDSSDLVGKVDMVKYITDDDYKQRVMLYYDIIKGIINPMRMTETIPLYKVIMDCFKSLLLANNMAQKSRLAVSVINNLKDSSNITDNQFNAVVNYVDTITVLNFCKTLPNLVLPEFTEGFDTYFADKEQNTIDFTTLNGLATFRKYFELRFVPELQKIMKGELSNLFTIRDSDSKLEKARKKEALNKLLNNKFIKHLQLVADLDLVIMATDIDLLTPNDTTQSRFAYNEILKGFEVLETIKFEDSDLTIADMFELYNLIVNKNRFGDERFTTIFKIVSKDDSIINRYLNFEANFDFGKTSEKDDSHQDFEINMLDYYIIAAPIINEASERFHTEPYVKVIDPVEGYIIKKYDESTNSYIKKDILPKPKMSEKIEDRYQRLENYADYDSFNMPFALNNDLVTSYLTFDDFSKLDDKLKLALKTDLENLLKDYSISNVILLYKIC